MACKINKWRKKETNKQINSTVSNEIRLFVEPATETVQNSTLA